MEKIGVNEIREKFLEFFKSKEHLILPSFSLVPKNDKSLLLINAGMAPLKSYFTGLEIPPSKRVATCQKCIRTGDIERVGKTARHGTFFEMLGNFSFGDYFKNEIIVWSWEFITKILKLPEDRLWVTIYQDDDEAFEIWNKKVGLSPERIVRMGKEDNFWEIGQGPCGPSSEIYFDRGKNCGCGHENCKLGCDCDRFVEFWNLVFTQFDKDENGNYNKLKNPNIDTGMGLERIATIMQEVNCIFEIDTMKNILNQICIIGNLQYGKSKDIDTSIRIICDHIRSVTFMVSDNILPSNEGRGYVLRRLIRRASRHGRLLGIKNAFLNELCDVVIENSYNAYPELLQKKEFIKKVIKIEEEKFSETIDQGILILNNYILTLKETNKNILSGDLAFKLYDTYGFPIELTLEILEEKNIEVDMEGFNNEMKNQKDRARAAREETNYMGSDIDIYAALDKSINTNFIGYYNYTSDAKILYIIKDNKVVTEAKIGDKVSIILDNTSFYAEMGGQVGDSGIIEGENFRINISDCKRVVGNKIIHIGDVKEGIVKTGNKAIAIVDKIKRTNIERNHTATHLLHSALKNVLGEHVEQAGSFVSAERLRFDFTHFEAITSDDFKKIEKLINNKILECMDVSTIETTINDAKQMGATALFGEKYGSIVRVVKAGDFSMELCGGTHVKNTSSIGIVKLISENGIASGIRRIEAVTGHFALDYIEEIENINSNISRILKCQAKDLIKKVEALSDELKIKDKEIENLKSKIALNIVDELVNTAKDIKGIKVITACVDADMNVLRDLGDKLRDKFNKSLIVLASKKDDKLVFVAMANRAAIDSGVHSGNIVKQIAKIAGGSGGGKADIAQAGGKELEKIQSALDEVSNILENMVK